MTIMEEAESPEKTNELANENSVEITRDNMNEDTPNEKTELSDQVDEITRSTEETETSVEIEEDTKLREKSRISVQAEENIGSREIPEPTVQAEEQIVPSEIPEPSIHPGEKIEFSRKSEPSVKVEEKISHDELPPDKVTVTATSTKDILITTPFGSDDNPHRVKVCVVGAGKVGVACVLSILMKRLASEVCLIDKDSAKAEAEAEDIRHAGVFLGNPLVNGTADITMVRDSAVVIIAIGEKIFGEVPKIRHNLEIFKKIVPAIAKLASRAILLIVTEPIDVMSYVAWKISKFPSNRVLGTGTLLDSMRFQYYLSKRLGVANTSINCMCIGARGHHSVPVWSNVHVGGVKLRDINPLIGQTDDPEKWHEITKSIRECDARMDAMKDKKGPNCWALGVCSAEIVDAIVRNTRVILPASTYIHTCSHGTDKDVYMSVPCVLGREGVHHMVRQRLTDQEKSSLQACADSIRNALRDSGILRDTSEDVQD